MHKYENELEKYLAELPIPRKENPLTWWKTNSTRFNTLPSVTRWLLCQARSQKIMVGGSFERNVDLFLWSYSANHSPGAVDELIFYGVCKPTFIRANCTYKICDWI